MGILVPPLPGAGKLGTTSASPSITLAFAPASRSANICLISSMLRSIRHGLDRIAMLDLVFAGHQQDKQFQKYRRLVPHHLLYRLATALPEGGVHFPDGVGVQRMTRAMDVAGNPAARGAGVDPLRRISRQSCRGDAGAIRSPWGERFRSPGLRM